MRYLTTILVAGLFLAPQVLAEKHGKFYRYVDENGEVTYSDKVPAEDSDHKKTIVNEHGVTIGELEGRKTAEELAAEREAEERALAMELQRRADRALLNTYLTIEEIMMHRDRRVELWQAQARVTELYLRNLERRLEMLRKRANNFSPYSEDPDAPMIDTGLMEDLDETEATIVKHNLNLEKYKEEEELIRERFAGDIERFKTLKGLE